MLIELLKDSNSDTRSIGASALADLSKNGEFQSDVVNTLLFRYLAQLSDAMHPAIPALIEQLEDSHPQVRSAGASTLGELSKNSGIQPNIVVTLLIRIRSPA